MKTLRTSVMLLVLIGLAGTLFAGGFALTGVGSRATAMGGAFRGVSDDASAMFWNPAGLAFMDENSIALGGTFILPAVTWDASGTAIVNVPGYSAKEYEAQKSLRAFPNVFLTMAKDTRLKYGLGVYVPYGLGTTWDAYQLPGSPLVYVDGFPTDEMSSSIAVIDIHPSVAYQILPNLSAGMGISIMYGTIGIDKISFNPALTPGTAGYLYTPITTELSGAGLGYGANMGLMFKPTECLSIGLSGKLASEINMEGEAEVFLWKPASVDGDGNPVPPAKIGGKSDIDATLKLPAEIGIGLAYKIRPNWTVSLDYAYTMWDRLDKVTVEMDTPIPMLGITESELIFDWENTSRISLGTEYDFGCNVLRAGFFMDESPIPEETQLPTISDINTKYSFNLGWGRSFGKITVDANFQYVMFPERKIEASAATANNLAGTYNANSMSGNIGLSYKF